MRPDPDTSPDRVRLEVTTHGWLGVQRVVVLLSARGYAVTAVEARPAASGPYWQVGVVLLCLPAELLLLQARLERLPSVTAVAAVPAPSRARQDRRGVQQRSTGPVR